MVFVHFFSSVNDSGSCIKARYCCSLSQADMFECDWRLLLRSGGVPGGVVDGELMVGDEFGIHLKHTLPGQGP